MTTTDREPLYQQAYATYAESRCLKTRELTKLAEPGLRAVVDLVLDAQGEATRVDLAPGDYWITSSEDGRGRAIVTSQGILLIEQFGGGWSDLGMGVHDSWTVEPREYGGERDAEWAAADVAARSAQEKAEREAEREKLIEQAARVCITHPNGVVTTVGMSGARALADAGLLTAPVSDGGAA